ncbi:MAG: hypothetical protein ACJAUP_000262 [Cellvibrionaceae bacterium]|jgi:hypothetical protein
MNLTTWSPLIEIEERFHYYPRLQKTKHNIAGRQELTPTD